MKKITDFIVEKRYYVLILFIIFTILCGIISQKVTINYEISKYLPGDSETRIGLDIMENNFDEIKSSTLNIMFEGLNNNEKEQIYNELQKFDGVDSVNYDNTENYNKENYTLYVLNLNDVNDSETAKKVYKDVTEKYKEYKIETSGDVSTRNAPVLPFYIIALAVFCALVILIIMCESYTEPFLFLATILMGVVLNKGTNIIFDSVSNITDSIAAILQMALSMDYSIMLMNRYRQEREVESDKVIAMKKALYNAFSSISSSSVTTIVGLIALVFMSFTIGKDLGFVLAKGVLFSLVTIFFVLPSLILLFDKAIQKTKKKCPKFNLVKMGKASYKCRFISAPLLILIFIASYFAKGTLGIDFSNSGDNEISKVFSEKNQMAVIYKTEDEAKISQYLNNIENNEKVDEVLAYSNTINEKLKYNEINNKLNELDSDTTIDEYILKIIYYNYYNNEENNEITFNEFVNFIKTDVYQIDNLNSKIDQSTKDDIEKLENFINMDLFNKNRNSEEIANILGIEKSNVDDLLILYTSKNNNLTISLQDFLKFLNRDVLTNSKYSSNISNENKSQLNMLNQFTNKSTIQTKMNSTDMAGFFEIDTQLVNSLYTYYINLNNSNTKLTISEFSNFVLNNLASKSEYSKMLNTETISNLQMISTLSNINTINQELSAKEISNLLEISEENVNSILLLQKLNETSESKYSLKEFITYVTQIKQNTNYLSNIDITKFETLSKIAETDTKKYTSDELAKMLNMNEVQINQMYVLIDYVSGNTSNWKISCYNFVNLLLNNIENEQVKKSINSENLAKLKLLQTIINSANAGISYTYVDLSKLVGIDESIMENIYTLYASSSTNLTLTPIEFVNFILNHQNDEMLNGKISTAMIAKLNTVQMVMNGTINNKKYNSTELSNLLSINKDNIDLLFALYSSKYINSNTQVSLYNFVNFILTDVVTDENYANSFDANSIKRLKTVKGIMDATLNNTKYTKDEIFTILSTLGNNIEKNTIDVLYTYYGSKNEYDDNWTLTIEELINYVNDTLLQDERYSEFISDEMKAKALDGKQTINDARNLLIGNGYSRLVINTKYSLESAETSEFIQNMKNDLSKNVGEFYIVGDSPMAYEMSKTFDRELNFITILTMIAIFIVVAITFRSILIPSILVLVIQCAVYVTMGILSLTGENVYFIALLIVQSILMGATIDYAILYTSYYLEHRKTMDVKEAVINSYNKSIHTILTSASILIIVTLIVGNFASAIAAKICKTISAGTMCSTILILIILPAILAAVDKLVVKEKK